MTVDEFFRSCECKSVLKVLSANDGRVLAHQFKPDKHIEVGKLKICALWAEIKVTEAAYGSFCSPIICCYAGTYWRD